MKNLSVRVPLSLCAVALAVLAVGGTPGAASASGWEPASAAPPTERLEARADGVPSAPEMGVVEGRRHPGDYRHGVTVYAGKSATSNFTSLFYAPWNMKFEDTYLLAIAGSTRLGTLFSAIDVDGEVNVAKRFGNDESWEFAGQVFFRYDDFPWDDVVHITVGVGIGPSYATGISETEKIKAGNNDKGSKFLNGFIPELILSDPDIPELGFVFRVHHRSGVFGLIDGVSGGSNFISFGTRYRF